MMNDHAKKIPIFWGHGISDPLVKYMWAERSVDFLKSELGIGPVSADNPAGLEFRGYRGLTHSASDEELEHLQAWMKKIIPA